MTQRWRPFVDRKLAQEQVSPDARRRDERLPGYLDFMAPLPANPDETFDIVQMLELLECTHGAGPVLAPLPVLQLALLSAVTRLGRSLTELAAQRVYESAALFVGALVEDEIERDVVRSSQRISQRRAPRSAVVPKSGSPNLEFEDFMVAAQMLIRVASTNLQLQSRRAGGLASACWALRQKLDASTASRRAEEMLLEISHTSGNTWKQQASAVRDLFARRGIPMPDAFRALFVPKQSLNQVPHPFKNREQGGAAQPLTQQSPWIV